MDLLSYWLPVSEVRVESVNSRHSGTRSVNEKDSDKGEEISLFLWMKCLNNTHILVIYTESNPWDFSSPEPIPIKWTPHSSSSILSLCPLSSLQYCVYLMTSETISVTPELYWDLSMSTQVEVTPSIVSTRFYVEPRGFVDDSTHFMDWEILVVLPVLIFPLVWFATTSTPLPS